MSTKSIVRYTLLGIFTAMLLIAAGMYGCPRYDVYKQSRRGEAELKRAEYNRRTKVYEAQAELDSAKLKAQAEIERAKGVAEANRIIADGLGGHDGYLRYLWIDKIAANAGREVIYVPTEAALPILESTRLVKP
jgi:regulator of protease activity HflC (stomatin/prohibitin superfamily)